MDNAKLSDTAPVATAPVGQIQIKIHSINRRQWWLWSTGVLVTLLLTLGIASFTFPGLLSDRDTFYAFNLKLAVRGLVGLILLFNLYTIYQQLQIHRIQVALQEQIGALGKLENRTEEVYRIAALDGLTGLYNRRSGEHRLAEEILRSQRHDAPFTVLMLDINELKQINDTYGHPVGDLMLRYFAERLQSAVRGSDVPIRLGGDEFLVLLPECKLSEVQAVLNRLNGITGEFDGHKIPLKFAAGWTDYIPGESTQALMMRVDANLYANKRIGTALRGEKEPIEIFQPGQSSRGETSNNYAADTLSRREYQVLQLLAQAKSNKEVAGALGISIRTVETHRAKIMATLNVHSVSELVLYAVRNNIIKIEDSRK
jgi:diguanylate cyclase (GGDEF)-like protein